jgi:protein CpxP
MTKVMDIVVTFFNCDYWVKLSMMRTSIESNRERYSMKLKNLSLITAAIVLTMAATSLAVKADTATSPLIIAQAQKGYGRLEALGLSEDQKARMAEIRQQTHEEIKAVLTPEQRQQLEAAKQSGQKWQRGMLRSLNLTEAQQNQIRQIKESKKAQIDAVLTPEQKQQLEQFRQNKLQRRQQRNGNLSPDL